MLNLETSQALSDLNKIFGTGKNSNPTQLAAVNVSFNFLGHFVPLLASPSFGKGKFTCQILH